MQKYDLRVLELAGRQHYVVSHEQLRDLGKHGQIETRLRSGMLEPLYESVYRLVGSPDTWHQRLLAACFATSGLSAASFRAGGQLWTLPGGEEIIEISGPRHDRTQFEGIRTHESFFLTERDITSIDAIPVTWPARIICDYGLLVHRKEMPFDTLELALHEALRRNLVDVRRVWREWERLGGRKRPGGRVVEQLLQHFVVPIRMCDTTPEVRLLQLMRAANLPEPVAQHRVWMSADRWYDLDFAWPNANVFCEFDSYKYHGGRVVYMDTTRRRLELETHGWHGVPVTDDELDAGAPLAIAVLRNRLSGAT